MATRKNTQPLRPRVKVWLEIDGEYVVINPVREVGLINFRVPSDVCSLLFGSEIASLCVPPRIASDLALLTGIAKVVL